MTIWNVRIRLGGAYPEMPFCVFEWTRAFDAEPYNLEWAVKARERMPTPTAFLGWS